MRAFMAACAMADLLSRIAREPDLAICGALRKITL
jgi:hypothetical protein